MVRIEAYSASGFVPPLRKNWPALRCVNVLALRGARAESKMLTAEFGGAFVNSDAVGWVSRAVLRLQVRDPILWAGDAWAIPSAWPASGLGYRPRIGGRRIVHRLASYASAQDNGTARRLNREMIKQFASPAASSSAQLFGKVA